MKHRLTISKDKINCEMLADIVDNACGVIQKMMLSEEDFNINKDSKDSNVYVISWSSAVEKQRKDIYEDFMLSLCEYSSKRKRKHRTAYTPKNLDNGNEKAYAYMLFNLLGMFGEKYADARAELLKPLAGTTNGDKRSSWRAE